MNSDATLLAVNPRLRNNRSGSTGSASASLPTDERSEEHDADDEQTDDRRAAPTPVVRLHQTEHDSEQVRRWRGRYRQRRAGRRAVTLLQQPPATGSNTMPIGTLSQKIHDHEAPSTMAPPTTGPTAIARPAIAPQAPSASPRRDGGTATLSSVRGQRGEDRAADALQRACRNQLACRRRQRGERRGQW